MGGRVLCRAEHDTPSAEDQNRTILFHQVIVRVPLLDINISAGSRDLALGSFSSIEHLVFSVLILSMQTKRKQKDREASVEGTWHAVCTTRINHSEEIVDLNPGACWNHTFDQHQP